MPGNEPENVSVYHGGPGAHTFGRCLRAAGVRFEDWQDLLGHRSGKMTTHYLAAELTRLIDAAESVCDRGEGKPKLVVVRQLNIG